jgi:hypothetical protein
MADSSFQSDVFKFVSLRPPVSADKKKQEISFISDPRVPEDTPVGKLTKRFDPKDGTKIPEQVRNFVDANKFDLNYPESNGNTNLSEIYDLASSIDLEEFDLDELSKGIENILDSSISNFLDNLDIKTQLNKIWDRYYAFYILARTENQNLDTLTKNLRVYHLLQLIKKSIVSDYSTLKDILAAKPIVSKIFADIPKPLIKNEQPKNEQPDPETSQEYRKLWSQLVDTHRAIEEIKNIKFDTKLTTETKNITTLNKGTGMQEESVLTFAKSNLAVNAQSFQDLHPSTRSILNTIKFNESNFQVAEPVMQLQSKLEGLYFNAYNIKDPEFLRQMPTEAKSIRDLAVIAGRLVDPELLKPLPRRDPTNIRAFIKPLGVGDLKVVKQKLKKYVAGEVAHIENVLRGEYKERKHRVLDRTEDIFTVANETNEETSKDLQTTERFELKKESEKTVQEQMSIQAGVTVSGSYGMVTFGAHGDFAYSTASQESNKNSSNFAREVIDKSISKIQKKTKEERTTKRLHEVEEINTHGIDNKDKPDHAVGVYRWVDKYYDAQIYNYGKRMMFEFIIPEPAAFYEFAQTHKPKTKITPPTVPDKWISIKDEKGNDKLVEVLIDHRDINVDNYRLYIRDYNVQGVTPPPLPYKTISASLTKEGMPLDGNPHVMNSKELIVPAGYISKVGVWWDMSAIWSAYSIIEVTIGNKIFRPLEIPRTDGSFDKRFAMGNQHDNPSIGYHWFWPENPIQVSVNVYDVLSFTLNVYALVERTWEAYEQWQIQTYEKIMTAYKAMQVEYEQKMASQQVQQGISIQGQNPRINREIEKTELKKQCVKMLMDTYLFGSFDAVKDDGNNPPDFDIFDALDEGKIIQFFEQAFEWENLTYLFYSYFWGRKSQWVHKSSIYDTDPLFTKFLQAGSARVVIPVRPGYNEVITYFMQTGKVWGRDGNPPLIKKEDGSLNDLFISIAEELRNQTDDLAKATPEGDSWEVVLPTTLVYLQKDSDLPTF